MKIGFSIQKIKDLIKNSISSLETRVTTLENSPGSGGISSSVFYLFNGYLYKDADVTTKVTADEFNTAFASTVLSILNMSDTENFGVYSILFSKSAKDENGYDIFKVFIMLENGTLMSAYTGPYEQQSGVQ